MFIPNKTINIIKTVALIVLSVLIVVIVGQSVLFIKLQTDNKVTMSTIKTQIDSTKLFDETSLVKHMTTEQKLKATQTQVDSLNKELSKLQNSVDGLLFNTQLLINNECQVTPYYMDKSLLEICKKQ